MAAGAMLLAGQAAASANIAWCVDDPPVLLQSPAGTSLVVNTQVYVSQSQVHLMRQVTDSAVSSPNSGGGTLVTVSVNLPQGMTTAEVVASVNRYNVYATAMGKGGETVTLYLVVPAS
jgi:hypothetical protein